MTGRHRLALAAVLLAFVALAVNASVLLPLWEPLDEAAAVEQAGRLLGGPAAARPALPGESTQPLAARAVVAGGLWLLDLERVDFLARPHAGGTPRDPARYLHGPDEALPFVGPARALHGLRLLSVAAGALAVLAAFALARRLLPQRPGAALLAAALLALLPTFLAASGALGPVALQAALLGAALASLAPLANGEARSSLRLLATGALLGAAQLAGASLLLVLPLAPLALLLGASRIAGWRARIAPLDRLAAGFLLIDGPAIAWRWAHGTDAAASVAPPAGAALAHWLPLLAWGHVARTAPGVAVGPAVLLAWSSLAVLAGLGLLWLVVRARRGGVEIQGRVAALLVAAVLLAAADSLIAASHGRAPDGRDLLPVGGALASLLAAGLAACCPAGRPRLAVALGTLLVLALAALAAVHEALELGPAFQPPNRAQDPHVLCFDPLAGVPEERRLATVRVLQPLDGAQLDAPPELVWVPVREADTRYSVHLGAPGAAWTLHTFEDQGLSLHDRYAVPSTIWDALPPEVDLVLRVVRLPALDEALSDEPLLVDESLPVRVRHKLPGKR